MSEVKVNKISPRSGTTVTLGDSGDTFTIPSGATINNQGTATNFGATGSASWTTTVKTSGFTAVAGEGYFVDTTSGAISVNLPAGTAGAVVAFKDYLGTFDTNALTLVQNGSDKIGGSTVNATLDTEGIAITLVFIDSTQGWLVTDSGLTSEAPTAAFVAATGGTVTTSGNFKIHTFTGPGAFCVSSAGNAAGSNSVDYLIVAGGGGGANNTSGGGGAGGYRETPGSVSGCYTASPIAGSVTALTVGAQNYPVTVGAGGAGKSDPGRAAAGSVSSFNCQSSAGGGGGAAGNNAGQAGGSGSGGSGGQPPGTSNPYPGGAGNTPPVSPAQGNTGGGGYDGIVSNTQGGGGGGAGAAGSQAASATGGNGGNGTTTNINGSPTTFAGGGGGGSDNAGSPGGTAGTGGSGGGGNASTYNGGNASDGTANTGGGGGGAGGPGASSAGGSGGSGIVIIRYKFQ